jgi:hypothetical protein
MLRAVISILIGAHGIGHILFLVPLLGIADWGQSTRSWLLTGEAGARLIGGILWIAVIIGFSAAVYGLWTHQSWWRSAAIAAALISCVGLLIFWAGPATSSAIAALIFNVLVIGALLVVNWPTVEAVGA